MIKSKMESLVISRKYLAELLDVNLTDLYRRLQKYEDASPKTNNKVPLEIARKLTKERVAKYHSPKRAVQCFFNFKGGTGKTTLTYNLSALFNLFGYKVLVIDCDPQAHLTRCFNGSENHESDSVFDVLCRQQPIAKIMQEVLPELYLVPSNVKLSFVDSQLFNAVRREEILKSAIDEIKDQFDFIFLDVNPSLSLLNRNVIVASDFINIICEAQPFSLAGMEMLLQEFNQLARIAANSKVEYNIMINKFEPNLLSNLEVVAALQNTPELAGHICENIVRKCEDFNYSAKNRLPVSFFANKSKSNAKNDILGLGKELLNLSSTLVDNPQIKVKHAA